MSTADEDRITLRQAEAVRLRVRGYSFREIGKELGISGCQAHTDVRAAMAETLKQTAEDTELERELALMRIAMSLRTVNEILDSDTHTQDGERDHELRLKALDRLVKLEERRAKLLGLDAPAKQEIDARVSAAASPAEAARLVREAFGEHAAKAADEPARALPPSTTTE